MLELNLRQAVLKDRYEIRGRISSGSYSEVFVARDRGDDSNRGNAVVIKALNSRLQGIPPPELEQMLGEKFQSESAILNKIRHANIVSILDLMCQKPDREGGPLAHDALPHGRASDTAACSNLCPAGI